MLKATTESENWFDEYISQAIKDNIRNIKKLTLALTIYNASCYISIFVYLKKYRKNIYMKAALRI